MASLLSGSTFSKGKPNQNKFSKYCYKSRLQVLYLQLKQMTCILFLLSAENILPCVSSPEFLQLSDSPRFFNTYLVSQKLFILGILRQDGFETLSIQVDSERGLSSFISKNFKQATNY